MVGEALRHVFSLEKFGITMVGKRNRVAQGRKKENSHLSSQRVMFGEKGRLRTVVSRGTMNLTEEDVATSAPHNPKRE